MKKILTYILLFFSTMTFGQNNRSINMDTINEVSVYKFQDLSESTTKLASLEIVEILSEHETFVEIKRNDGSKGFIQRNKLESYSNLTIEKKKELSRVLVRDYIKLLVKRDSGLPGQPPIEIEKQIEEYIIYSVNSFMPTVEELICKYNDLELLIKFSYYIVNSSKGYSNEKILESFANCYFCQTEIVKRMIDNSGFLMDQIFIGYLSSVINNESIDFSKYPDIKKKKRVFNKWIRQRKIAEPKNAKITKGSFPLK